MKQEHNNESRRQFLQKSAVIGTGIILAGPASQRLFAQGSQQPDFSRNVASKGYAARDTSRKLSQWTFERRPVGVQLIKASEVNSTWEKVINKEARYRYVIDAATF